MCSPKSKFVFYFVEKNEVMNKIGLLQVNKTVQYIYIPSIVIKEIQIEYQILFSQILMTALLSQLPQQL